jgi:hypothetical protein
MRNRLLPLVLLGGAAIFQACSDHSITAAGMQQGQGKLAMQLIDDPTALDSIASVNIFVVRVDARMMFADSAAADSNVGGDGDFDDRDHVHRDSTAWVTIASPNKLFNVLALQGGDTAFLGSAFVDSAHFRAFRLIIDPSQSSVVLKNGMVLTDSTTPSVDFFSRGRQGILVDLDNDADVHAGETTTITLDFRLGESLFLRSQSIGHDGLLIRAIVRGHSH